uniref:Uncharacterized protein n=1 Tax=Ditylenchus dipsaci TaxID=166011 RepID=A0A915DX86_9BILA
MSQNNGFGYAGGNSSGNRYGGFAGTGGGSFGGGASGGGGYPTSFGGRSEGYGNVGSNLSSVHWDQVKMHPLKKDIYHEHPAVSRRDQNEIDKWITDNQVTLQGKSIPRPVFEFKEANFPELIENLLLANYNQAYANSVYFVASSYEWPRYDQYCQDRFWKDTRVPSSWHLAHFGSGSKKRQ